ncbi:hereditary hemochromatosis protein homolog [Synchiropus splendidus]|uniref:hereditary hemochromatosis protein homolog n=1 Tax=Synchiropus splendidus TaxID=270530 RepID=UPI00237DB4A2|nr:hereditary hemochromatosis protein homolog [Synchiropus splendidus]
MWTFWLQLMLISASVQQVTSSGAGRHSLQAFATYISGPSQLPKFSTVLMLDDLQVAYYDSTLGRLVSSNRDRTPLDLGDKMTEIIKRGHLVMRQRLEDSKQYFNQTEGLHVLQTMTGCEIQDGQPTFIMSRDGFDGQDINVRMHNMTHFSCTTGDGWASLWDAARWQILENLYRHLYLPTCEALLKQLLEQKKKLLTRRVPPRLRVFSRQGKGGALLTCLATDFYPRHINLTLLRDGRQVEEDQLSAGPVLPNANGLYQVRKTLVLTEQELQQKHNYTCTAAHLSLDNRLQVSWRAESYHSRRAHMVSPFVLVALILLLLLLLVLAKCGKPHRDSVETESETQRL